MGWTMIPSTADILRAVADAARHSEGVGGVLMALPFALRLEQIADKAEQADVPSERVKPWIPRDPSGGRPVPKEFSEGNASIGPQFMVTPRTQHKPEDPQ
jgi:hypothetical protein